MLVVPSLSDDRSCVGQINRSIQLPYGIDHSELELALDGALELVDRINEGLAPVGKKLETLIPAAALSTLMSEFLTVSVETHCRAMAVNSFHNGHPDTVPAGLYLNDAAQAGSEGIEMKATCKGKGAFDAHGARSAWYLFVRMDRAHAAGLRYQEVLLARLEPQHFRTNARGELGTKTASPNRDGLVLLRAGTLLRRGSNQPIRKRRSNDLVC